MPIWLLDYHGAQGGHTVHELAIVFDTYRDMSIKNV